MALTDVEPEPVVDRQRVVALAAAVADLATGLDRDDLAGRLRAASARVRRPDRVVCVVGEFKQGKSSLVNALIGRGVCPVDDDLATAVVTVLHHAEEVTVVAHRPGAEPTAVELDQLAELLTERGNPENTLGLARVDIGFPNELLASGLAVVDTPGAGGLGSGFAAAVLGFLPFADALLFVSDLSSPLAEPELALLRRAQERCPSIVVCLTKADLHPAGARVADLTRASLAAAGIAAPVAVVSSALRVEGLRRGDRELNVESGFPHLVELLDQQVMTGAADRAAEQCVAETSTIVEQLRSVVVSELEVLADPPAAVRIAEEVEAARARLEHLRGPATRWSTALADGIADLTATTTGELRTRLRASGRAGDELMEAGTTPAAWLDAMRHVQDLVADAVADTFATVDAQASAIAERLAELVGEIDLDVEAPAGTIDVRAAFQLTPPSAPKSGRVQTGLSFLGGVQGGALTLGTLTMLLPAAMGAVLAAGPVVIGTGLLMGRRRIVEERNRQVATQRQAARQSLRQFIDDVQLQVGAQVAESVRVVQRTLRDQISARVTELVRTQQQIVGVTESAASADDRSRRERVALLQPVLDQLGVAQRALDELR